MPRFFFDVYDGTGEFTDRNGINLREKDIPEEACNLLRLLSDVRESFGKHSLIVLHVRSETGEIVYQATGRRKPERRDGIAP